MGVILKWGEAQKGCVSKSWPAMKWVEWRVDTEPSALFSLSFLWVTNDKTRIKNKKKNKNKKAGSVVDNIHCRTRLLILSNYITIPYSRTKSNFKQMKLLSCRVTRVHLKIVNCQVKLFTPISNCVGTYSTPPIWTFRDSFRPSLTFRHVYCIPPNTFWSPPPFYCDNVIFHPLADFLHL